MDDEDDEEQEEEEEEEDEEESVLQLLGYISVLGKVVFMVTTPLAQEKPKYQSLWRQTGK